MEAQVNTYGHNMVLELLMVAHIVILLQVIAFVQLYQVLIQTLLLDKIISGIKQHVTGFTYFTADPFWDGADCPTDNTCSNNPTYHG